VQRRRRGLFRQQARRLPRLHGFHARFRTGADAAEFDGALGFGRGLKRRFFQVEIQTPDKNSGVNFFDAVARIF
jgi:hypothetical protein